MRKDVFNVIVAIPPTVSIAQMRAYIEEAVQSMRGGLPLEDPMFHLERSDVEVKYHSPDTHTALFSFLAHGNAEHRTWLREAINAFYEGKPRPADAPTVLPDRFRVSATLKALTSALREQRTTYHLTLRQLIEALRGVGQDWPVQFDFNRTAPAQLHSYRGYYEDLAIGWDSAPRTSPCILVGSFLERLKNARGEIFTGYKGGEYVMDDDTPLWAAQGGESTGRAIVGIHLDEEGEALIIDTLEVRR